MKYFFDSFTASTILQAIENGIKEIHVSLDLGRSTELTGMQQFEPHSDSLRKIAKKEGSVFFLDNGEFFQAAISEDHYYKLYSSLPGKAPALLIDGVLMHRVKDTDPLTDARSKAKACATDGAKMLEICTGLGYSALACLERGASAIDAIELNPHVLNLARINPWSKHLFEDSRITLIEGDAVEILPDLEENEYDGILHDPPRFSMGSSLYTGDFYESLFRVLRPGGTLFHYVGSPGGTHRRQDLQKGIMLRLRTAGFGDVVRRPEALGVAAKKPK